MTEPMRKVYRKTADGEEGPLESGLLGVKAGETIRLEPIDEDDAKHCPTDWFVATSDGYLMGVPDKNDPKGPHKQVQAINLDDSLVPTKVQKGD